MPFFPSLPTYITSYHAVASDQPSSLFFISHFPSHLRPLPISRRIHSQSPSPNYLPSPSCHLPSPTSHPYPFLYIPSPISVSHPSSSQLLFPHPPQVPSSLSCLDVVNIIGPRRTRPLTTVGGPSALHSCGPAF